MTFPFLSSRSVRINELRSEINVLETVCSFLLHIQALPYLSPSLSFGLSLPSVPLGGGVVVVVGRGEGRGGPVLRASDSVTLHDCYLSLIRHARTKPHAQARYARTKAHP